MDACLLRGRGGARGFLSYGTGGRGFAVGVLGVVFVVVGGMRGFEGGRTRECCYRRMWVRSWG